MNAQEKEDYCRRLLMQARIDMLAKHPFVASLAYRLPLEATTDAEVETARTNGRRIVVNADYFIGLTPEERMGIVAHEVWHCAMRHHQRLGDRDLERFNYACDIETDLILTADGFVIEMLPYQEEWVGQSAEWIYERISSELALLDCNKDEHVYAQSKRAKSLPKPEKSESASEEKSSEPADKDATDKDENWAAADGEDKESEAASEEEDLSDEEGEELDWDAILQEIASKLKQAGKLPGHFDCFVKASDVEVQDWRNILANFLTMFIRGDRSWIPPDRRHVYKKLYLPGRRRIPKLNIVLAIDTSGSTEEYLGDFVAELQAICNAFGEYEITLLECDTRIVSIQKIDNEKPLNPAGLKMMGMGGTDLRPPFTYVAEHPELEAQMLLYLTDGFGTAPAAEPAYPVLWCLTENGERPASWGLSIQLSSQKRRA